MIRKFITLAALLGGLSAPAIAGDLPRRLADVPPTGGTLPPPTSSIGRPLRELPPPPPRLYTCSPDIRAYSRPELAEFWAIIKGSPSPAILRDRLGVRFGQGANLFPIYFDACIDYADGMGPQRHRTAIRDIVIRPGDETLALPRVIVQTEVVSPPQAHEMRAIPVDLDASRF